MHRSLPVVPATELPEAIARSLQLLDRGLRLYWKGVYGCIIRGLRLCSKGVYGCIGKGFTVVLERGLRLYDEGLRVGSWTLSMGAQNTMRK